MKSILLLIVFIVIGNVANSQIRDSKHHILVAYKKYKERYFVAGQKIDLSFKDSGLVEHYKGTLTDVKDGVICFSSFRKHTTSLFFISADSIIAMHKLLRKSRLVSGIFSIVLISATTLFLKSASSINNNARDNYSFVIALPLIIASVVSVGAFLSTFIEEQINTTSVKKGWRFSIH